MREVIERHGGTVEKFIGDAVMAVFGVPRVHEDDALRAVRAAVEMRAALVELGIAARIGVNTGEVVAHEDEALVAGDVVNSGWRARTDGWPSARTIWVTPPTVEHSWSRRSCTRTRQERSPRRVRSSRFYP